MKKQEGKGLGKEMIKKQLELAQNHYKPKKMPDPSNFNQLCPELVQSKIDRYKAKILRA